MVTALDLVVGVPAGAIVAASHALQDRQTFGLEAFEQAQCGNGILDSGPDLVRIAHRDGWSTAIRPGAQQQTGVIGIRELAEAVLPAAKAMTQVGRHDRAQRGLHMVARENVPQPQLVRPPLAIELISEASGTEPRAVLGGRPPEVPSVPQ